MRWLALCCLAGGLWAQTREGNTVRFARADGGAEIEWISDKSFRVARRFGAPLTPSPAISGEVKYTVLEREPHLLLKSVSLTIEVDPAEFRLRVQDSSRGVWLTNWETLTAGAVDRALLPEERIYGIGAREALSLDARGTKTEASAALAVSSRGYGVFFAGGPYLFDLTQGFRVKGGAPDLVEYVFYLGPRLKDIYERHTDIVPQRWFLAAQHARALSPLARPPYAKPVPLSLPAILHASLAGVTVPAVDCRTKREAWCDYMPVMVGEDTPLRRSLEPYLVTYLQEVKDRGYPVLRPIPLQYPGDLAAGANADVFMLGDELLIAPVVERDVRFPMGIWTDLRTNQTYSGKQSHSVKGPGLPVFAKNGALVPFARDGYYEAHYFPKLGGEFFIYESDLSQWTQLHASPAGEYLRLESETKVSRDYEWIVHHVSKPVSVESEAKVTWRYDEALKNLHVRHHAAAGSDVIVNLRFADGPLHD
ncbi:MAG: hypothetical protein K2X03_05360 [Bryobacteraceae bacterium]|nr:hypothetical protein [Bryobacteraceae bacterium]